MANYYCLLKKLVRNAYNKNMFATNTATCMLLFGIGDGITQYIELNKNNSTSTTQLSLTAASNHTAAISTTKSTTPTTANALTSTTSCAPSAIMAKLLATQDWTRTGKMVAMGSVIGPLGHIWYTYLDRVFPKKTRSVIFRKILCDQLAFAPFLNVVFIAGLHLLEGERLETLIESLKEKLLTLYVYDCMIWPPAQLLNFYFISPQHRVLYVNVVTLIWNCISSFIMFNDVSFNSFNSFE